MNDRSAFREDKLSSNDPESEEEYDYVMDIEKKGNATVGTGVRDSYEASEFTSNR